MHLTRWENSTVPEGAVALLLGDSYLTPVYVVIDYHQLERLESLQKYLHQLSVVAKLKPVTEIPSIKITLPGWCPVFSNTGKTYRDRKTIGRSQMTINAKVTSSYISFIGKGHDGDAEWMFDTRDGEELLLDPPELTWNLPIEEIRGFLASQIFCGSTPSYQELMLLPVIDDDDTRRYS